MKFSITPLEADVFRDRLPEALRVYVDAMGYPSDVIRSRASAWLDHSRRAGWSGWAAFATRRRTFLSRSGDELVGICYGYHGEPGQWWYDQVSRGLAGVGSTISPDFVELTELHVSPDWQGHGLGSQLLQKFLEDRPEATVMLSTPEVSGDANRAWRLYGSLGFRDVLRNFRFAGDPRPFAVLERPLPLGADLTTGSDAGPGTSH